MNRHLQPLIQRIHSMPTLLRTIIGVFCLFGGLFWFLPMLGLWMIPFGLFVLSFDFAWARRRYIWVKRFYIKIAILSKRCRSFCRKIILQSFLK